MNIFWRSLFAKAFSKGATRLNYSMKKCGEICVC